MRSVKVFATPVVDPLVEHHEAEVPEETHQEDDLRNELAQDAHILAEEPEGGREGQVSPRMLQN